METLLAAGTLVAVVALVYLFCVRPMRRHRCAMSPQRKQVADLAQLDQIALMRSEVAMLRTQLGDGTPDDHLAGHA